jgi:hypothetical protein
MATSSGQKLLGSTLTAALAVETVGAIDPYGGRTYLPSPRTYLAIWIVWFVLGVIASAGGRASRTAGQFSILVLLAMMMGPFGKKAIALVAKVGNLFKSGNASGPAPPPPGPQPI